MVYIPLKNGTIPHEVQAKFKGSSVLLRPARSGTGIIAGGTIRAIMEAAGAANVLCGARDFRGCIGINGC